MAKCTLIRSLHDRYDSTVISALQSHGYDVNVIPFENAAEAFQKDDPIILCGAQDCIAGTATLANDFLNRGNNLIVLGGPAFMNEHYPEQGLKTTAVLAEIFANGGFGRQIRMDFSRSAEDMASCRTLTTPTARRWM